MLAELAAFNAGFAVVKQTIMNGKDITTALGSIASMIGAEEDLRARETGKRITFGQKWRVKAPTIFQNLYR